MASLLEVNRLFHPWINNVDPVLIISDPTKLSPTLLTPFDCKHLGASLGNFNQFAITTEVGEEIAMQHFFGANIAHILGTSFSRSRFAQSHSGLSSSRIPRRAYLERRELVGD